MNVGDKLQMAMEWRPSENVAFLLVAGGLVLAAAFAFLV